MIEATAIMICVAESLANLFRTNPNKSRPQDVVSVTGYSRI